MYVGSMTTAGAARKTALLACALGAVAVGCLGSAWLLNPYPVDAQCATPDGYAAIKAHAETNGVLTLVALASAVCGAVICVAGAFTARGGRIELPRTPLFVSPSAVFLLGLVAFLCIGFVSLAGLIASGLYCQS